jgi:hypothetical protein
MVAERVDFVNFLHRLFPRIRIDETLLSDPSHRDLIGQQIEALEKKSCDSAKARA